MIVTSAEGRALLAAIVADPEDVSVRLVYADWCEENGQGERSEFIRVQCELAAMPRRVAELAWESAQDFPTLSESIEPEDCEAFDRAELLWRRSRELLEAHHKDWAAPAGLPCWVNWDGSVTVHREGSSGESVYSSSVRFGRGFIEEVHCCLADWVAHGPRLVRACPLLSVRPSDKRPRTDYPRDGTGRFVASAAYPAFFWWRALGGGAPERDYDLPAELFDLLPVSRENVLEGLNPTAVMAGYFGDAPEGAEAEAHAALSTACLAWARSSPPA